MNEVLFYLVLAIGLINTVHLGFYIVGANLYDIMQFSRLARRAKEAKKRVKRPLVSVIVPAHNEELVIERCLESIRRSSYRKIEVIVHNDRSTDATGRIIRAYQQKYPKFNLRLVNRRHQAGKAGGVNYCIKQHSKGELIMTLDADCILDKQAIKHAVAYFGDPQIAGVAANVRIMEKSTVLGILQRFEHLIGYRSKKFYTLANCEFIVGGVASTYRREVLRLVKYYDTDSQTEDIGLSMKVVALGNRQNRIVYASDVVASTEGAHSFKALLKQRYRWKMGSLQNLIRHAGLVGSRDTVSYSRSLTWYRLPMAFLSEVMLLLQPVVIGYLLFLSIEYLTIGMFLGAYLTITGYVLLTIWPDEHATKQEKFKMSIYAPIMYFFFYIMELIQLISIVRCLRHPKSIARRTAQVTTWVSPERLGQHA